MTGCHGARRAAGATHFADRRTSGPSAWKWGPSYVASTTTEAQHQRLLTLLRVRPRHTHELRSVGISHPAGRVRELIRRGYEISSARVTSVDGDGYTHVGVALYSLLSEPAES